MTGGWKVLQAACPKCMEEKCDDDDSPPITSVVKSINTGGKTSSGGTAIQVAKRFSSKWKLTRPPSSSECDDKGTDVGISDSVSVYSKKSTISTLSRQSTRSVKSTASSTRSGVSGKASSSGRYGEMPFDGDGYCCRHPSVQIAQKKMMGGFKILKECPECAAEDEAKKGSRRSRSRSKSKSRRSSSRRRTTESSGDNQSVASSKKKKRIRVKNLKTDDGNGRVGRYTGYVNDDHVPNGEGVIVYDDDSEWAGEWAEGTQRNGKMRKSKQ